MCHIQVIILGLMMEFSSTPRQIEFKFNAFACFSTPLAGVFSNLYILFYSSAQKANDGKKARLQPAGFRWQISQQVQQHRLQWTQYRRQFQRRNIDERAERGIR